MYCYMLSFYFKILTTDDNFDVKKRFYSLFLRFNLVVKSYYQSVTTD